MLAVVYMDSTLLSLLLAIPLVTIYAKEIFELYKCKTAILEMIPIYTNVE